MAKLNRSFYTRPDVLQVAKDLLGCKIVTKLQGKITTGLIVDTEAYAGINDRASHAYNNKRTPRTEIMYGQGGVAYVYQIYGLHFLLNIITNKPGIPQGVMLRAIQPLEGIDVMLERRGKLRLDYSLTNGPGTLTKALGITKNELGQDVLGNRIWVEPREIVLDDSDIVETTRVGIDYAGDDAYLPYRFYIKENPWRSKGKGLSV